MRDRLIDLLKQAEDSAAREIQIRRLEATERVTYGMMADYLIANGVITPPCKVGDTVWIIERTSDATPCDVSGFIFLAACKNAVIVSPRINGSENINRILNYHMIETAKFYDTDLCVFPLADCYASKEEAEARLEELKGAQHDSNQNT